VNDERNAAMSISGSSRKASLRTGRDRVAQVLVLDPWALLARFFSWF
jgi:hypothetical protein